MTEPDLFTLHANTIPVSDLYRPLKQTRAGGFCSFEGWVRNHHMSRSVTALEYEAYEPLAIKEGCEVMRETLQRFPILAASAAHRIGHLIPGDLAVWIGVCAEHRKPAFDACAHLIEAIKQRVPIWKLEFYDDGSKLWVDPTIKGPSP